MPENEVCMAEMKQDSHVDDILSLLQHLHGDGDRI